MSERFKEYEDFGKYGKMEWERLQNGLSEQEFHLMKTTGALQEACESAEKRADALEESVAQSFVKKGEKMDAVTKNMIDEIVMHETFGK